MSRLKALAESRPVAKVAQAFEAAGFELALVGGPVRDAFLGVTAHDLDFTTNANPDEILRIVAPVADAHWDIGRDFGTIGARVAGENIEITTYRADSYDGQTRKPEVVFGDSLEADLARRDFTVNALALRVPNLELVDPTVGLEDLIAGRLCTPAAPEVSFSDDPLRMLRGVRFASQLGFSLDAAAAEAIRDSAGTLERISAERIQEELRKLIACPAPRVGLELMVETGLAEYVLPELPALKLETDAEHNHKDVYAHSLQVLDQAIELEGARHPGEEPDVTLRLAALLHDIGKPATKRVEKNGAVTFYNHDLVGSRLAKKRLTALRFPGDQIKQVARLVELHMRFFGYTDANWTDSAVRRYVRDAGDLLERLHILTRADVTTRNRRKAARLEHAYDNLEERIAELREQEELDAVRPELDGEQIMAALGIKPGPIVGRAYKFLLDLRLDEGAIGEDAARERLLDWAAENGIQVSSRDEDAAE